MSQRGDYRPIYSVLQRSDEFKALSKEAKLVWYGLKLNLGPSGIDEIYDDELAEVSGVLPHEVEPARQELIDGRWIEVEGRVHWLRNGLRFEPNISLNHAKQRAGIERHLKGLPKLGIVNRMAVYYGLDEPFQISHKNGSSEASERLTEGSRNKEPLKEPLKEREPERERESRAPEEAAALQPLNPTDEHRALAAELHLDLDAELRKWRLQRQAAGITPADPVADFALWLTRAPEFNRNGNGASGRHEPEPPGITKRFDPPPEDDAPPADPETRAAGLALVKAAVGGLRIDRGDPVESDPEVIQKREVERARQLALAKGGKP